MIFKGYGVIWNGKKNKTLVNFKNTPEYETNDPEEIEILSRCNHITERSGGVATIKPIESDQKIVQDQPTMTKKEVMESLDASGIDYNPRDKKEVLLSLLEG